MTAAAPITQAGTGPGIEISQLRKSFAGPDGQRVQAVRGIDLSIGRGETVALLGPNGAGKSTTIDMLLGLLKPDAGTVSVFGSTPAAAIASGSVGGMLQQGAPVRDVTVRELVRLVAGLYPHPLNVDHALELAGAADIATRKTNKLSGGQSQRVRFAVALVSNAQLLVLDEPTVALDVQSRHDFWTTIREFSGSGKTIIFATHYLEEADAYADRVVLMAGGGIVADGATSEIRGLVNSRTIKTTLPDVDADRLRAIAGVTDVERHGDSAILTCSDSDIAIRALVHDFPDARDLEIRVAGLEEAFLQLTADSAGPATTEGASE